MMISPVLLCIDGSDQSLAAVARGRAILDASTPLSIVAVMDDPHPVAVTGGGHAGGTLGPDDFREEYEGAASAARDVLAAATEALELPDAETYLLEGDPGPAICRLARDVSASAIVLGSRGRGGLKRAVLGSVSDHVIRNAHCPVVVTGPSARDDI